MDIQKTLNEKKELLRKLVDESNSAQEFITKKNREILEVNGMVRQLQELLAEKPKEVKEEKK